MVQTATDRLSMVRTFAKPGYTPAKHVRIYKAKWYLATMQNVERDPRCDYIGLAAGEYTELVNGTEAKTRRDSQLNHLNHLELYTGDVYEFIGYPHGHALRPTYWRTLKEAQHQQHLLQEELRQWLDAVRHAITNPRLSAASIEGCKTILDNPPTHWQTQIRQLV